MIRFWTPGGLGISLGLVTERCDADEIIAELRRAYAEGDQRPGQDRLTVIAPGVDTSETPVSDLFRIQQVSAQLDQGRATKRRPKSVFAMEPGKTSVGTRMYLELWKHLPGAVPDFAICHSLEEAESLMGCIGLDAAFEARVQPSVAAASLLRMALGKDVPRWGSL